MQRRHAGLWTLVGAAPYHAAMRGRRRAIRVAIEALALSYFVGLAIVWTWPLALHLSGSLVNAPWWYDGLLNSAQLETFSWNLLHRPSALLEGYQFYPHPDVLSFTEQVPALAVVARLFRLAGATPIGAYNLVLLLGLVLDGWVAFLLVRTITGEMAVAFLAATMVEAMPYFVYELGRVQLLWCWPLFAAIWFLHRLAIGEGVKRAIAGLAVAVVLTYWSCVYCAVLAIPLIIVATLVYASSGMVGRRGVFLLRTTGAMAIGVASAFPGLLVYRRVSNTYGFGRSLDIIDPADLSTYLHLVPRKWPFWAGALAIPTKAAEQVLFPGGVLLGLAVAAVVVFAVALARRTTAWGRELAVGRGRRLLATLWLVPVWAAGVVASVWMSDLSPVLAAALITSLRPRAAGAADARTAAVRALGIISVAAFLLSLGRSVEIGGATVTLPLRWLFDVVPGFHAIRLVSRWGAIATASTACAVASAGVWIPESRRWLRVGGPALLTVMALVELHPRPQQLIRVAPLVDDRPGNRFLRDHPGGAVAALPVRGAGRPTDGVMQDAVLTYAAACFHRHPTVNGMSGFAPPFYTEVVLPVLAAFPDAESLRLLDALGVRWIYIRGELLDPARFRLVTAFATAHPERFRVALQRGDDVVLERVGNLRSPLEQTKGAESVAIAALPAGCTAQALAPGGTVSVPGDLGQGGGWVSGAPQLGGETITIECQQPIDAAGFRFGLGGRFAAYPRGLKIERRRDEGEWEPILIEEDAIDLERLVLHPLDDWVVKRFAPVRAKSWRIIQTGSSARDPWAVAGIGTVPPAS